MTKRTAEELEGKFVVAFDTILDGWDCVKDDKEEPFLYDNREEAFEDADLVAGDFVIPAAEYIHNRKFIYTPAGGQITGEPIL